MTLQSIINLLVSCNILSFPDLTLHKLFIMLLNSLISLCLHIFIAKIILHDLKSALNFGLHFQLSASCFTITAHSDVDWASAQIFVCPSLDCHFLVPIKSPGLPKNNT